MHDYKFAKDMKEKHKITSIYSAWSRQGTKPGTTGK